MRTVVGRFICSCGALASGIALGREGPSVQIGGGVASILGQRLGLKQARLSSLIPVGAAAAVSAAFNTPIAGVLFSLEEVVGDLHAPVLGSAVLASATAWVTLHLLLGGEPLFHVPQYELVHPIEFLLYALLGVAGGLCSLAFVKLTIHLRAQFLKLPGRTRWAHPVFGGLTVGLLALWSPPVLGVGYDYVGQVLNGDFTLGFVLTLLVLKLVASAACYGSGNAGGIFGPSLFLGAMCGAGVGSVAHQFLPHMTANPGAYALVGMGALFAGIIRAPFTSVFMIFELTPRLLHRRAADDRQYGESGHLPKFSACSHLRCFSVARRHSSSAPFAGARRIRSVRFRRHAPGPAGIAGEHTGGRRGWKGSRYRCGGRASFGSRILRGPSLQDAAGIGYAVRTAGCPGRNAGGQPPSVCRPFDRRGSGETSVRRCRGRACCRSIG